MSSDIWHQYHSWYFKIIPNFIRLTAREIMKNNFETSWLMVLMPNVTTNHAITYTNIPLAKFDIGLRVQSRHTTIAVLCILLPYLQIGFVSQ